MPELPLTGFHRTLALQQQVVYNVDLGWLSDFLNYQIIANFVTVMHKTCKHGPGVLFLILLCKVLMKQNTKRNESTPVMASTPEIIYESLGF